MNLKIIGIGAAFLGMLVTPAQTASDKYYRLGQFDVWPQNTTDGVYVYFASSDKDAVSMMHDKYFGMANRKLLVDQNRIAVELEYYSEGVKLHAYAINPSAPGSTELVRQIQNFSYLPIINKEHSTQIEGIIQENYNWLWLAYLIQGNI